MKSIFKDGVYDRVSNEMAELRVNNQGWKFVPKQEYKTNTRIVTEVQVEQQEKKEKTISKKAEKRLKIKEKQRQD